MVSPILLSPKLVPYFQKVRREAATITLVAPFWVGAPWFPDLLDLLCEQPMMLPKWEDIFLPVGVHTEVPLNNPTWKSLQTQKIKAAAADLIQDAWRASTKARYNSQWRQWVAWCITQHIDSNKPLIENFVNFLAAQFVQGKKYGVIAGYRSAVSTTLTWRK